MASRPAEEPTTVEPLERPPGEAEVGGSGDVRVIPDEAAATPSATGSRTDSTNTTDTIDLRGGEPEPAVALRSGPVVTLPRITVLVPTLNEEAKLPDLLDDLASQSHRPHQVLVIDGGSQDQTRQNAASRIDLPVQVLDNPARRVPQALNIGLASSTGDVVARIDGHARINRAYLETIARHFHADPDLGGVGGTKRAVATTRTGTTIAKVLSSRFGVGGSRYHYADSVGMVDHIPFGAYTRKLLEELGGWDEMFSVNQDYELDFRVRQTGRSLLLDPAARIEWHSRETIPRLAHQYYRYGQGKALVVWRHPSSAKPRHLLPAVAVVGLGGSVVAAAAATSPWPLAAVAVYAGLCGTLGAAVDGITIREWPTATAAVATMQLTYGAGLLRGFGRRVLRMDPDVSSSQTGSLSRPGS